MPICWLRKVGQESNLLPVLLDRMTGKTYASGRKKAEKKRLMTLWDDEPVNRRSLIRHE